MKMKEKETTMKAISQSQNDREVEIPNDTPMLVAEDTKRLRSFRNENNVRTISGEMFLAGDLWVFERKGERQ